MSKTSLLEQRLEVLEANFKTAMEEFKTDLKNLENPPPATSQPTRDYANPMSWVKNWEDICECAKIDPAQFAETWSILDEDEFAYKQLKIITGVITNNHKFKFDGKERYYWIWWDLSSSGFAFSYSAYDNWSTYANVAARLLFRSETEAAFVGRTAAFVEIYKKYIKQ